MLAALRPSATRRDQLRPPSTPTVHAMDSIEGSLIHLMKEAERIQADPVILDISPLQFHTIHCGSPRVTIPGLPLDPALFDVDDRNCLTSAPAELGSCSAWAYSLYGFRRIVDLKGH